MRIPTALLVLAACAGSTTPRSQVPDKLTNDMIVPNASVDVPAQEVTAVTPKEDTARVMFPEGRTMLEVFALLEGAHVANAKELEAVARDKDFLAKFGIVGDTVEGYLFPDTYLFRIDEKPEVVLTRLIKRHQDVWKQLVDQHPDETANIKARMGWSDRDILTMASIVEKEAAVASERPRIAQVFINRLSSPTFKPKRLQTDPATRYGCIVPLQKSAACIAWNDPCVKRGVGPGCDRLHRAQLDDRDNPYNTYTNEGLPPGPIANPGKAAIDATLLPDGSDYFYFVGTAKGARTHAFAKTAAEHARNVQTYVDSNPTNEP